MAHHFIYHPGEYGQGLVEYALILVLVAIVVIVGLAQFGTTLTDSYCEIVASLGGDVSGICETDTVVITRADYDSGHQELHLDATSDGGYDPDVTLTASPGGTMVEKGGDHYHLKYTLTGCPCTVTVTSSKGGSAQVTVNP